MKLLITGGTRFVGRHIAEAALDRGWEITLLHRGQSGPDLFPNADHRIGDRFEDLHVLDSGNWDFAVDTSAYFPRAVKLLGEKVQDRVGRMAFISTVSVYESGMDTTIDAPKMKNHDPETEEVNGETYGYLKVLCEEELQRIWGDRAWIIRPGIICSAYDPTDRFTYWVDRVARFSIFNGPHRLEQPVQGIDARALAEFVLDGLVTGHTQTTNCTGPLEQQSFETFIAAISKALGVSTPHLLSSGEPKLPLELPADGTSDGMFSVDVAPQVALGLKHPDFLGTIQRTWDWFQTEGRQPKVGNSDEAELASGGILR